MAFRSFWMRFLSERRQGKRIWQADREDIAAYHAARRRSSPPHRISASSWNRAVAALEKFYGWAVEEGLMATSPFGPIANWRPVRNGRFAPTRTNRAREPGARRGDLRFVSLDHFLAFRDVGLRGRRLDGHPASIAKGGREREIRIPVRLLRRLADYLAIERANTLADNRHPVSEPTFVGDEPDRTSVAMADDAGTVTRVRLDVLTPRDRRRLVTVRGEPMALWLNEAGRPMTPEAWSLVFRRASARCRAEGIELDVRPHALRHYMPSLTMSGSFLHSRKCLRTREISYRHRRTTRHSQSDLQAVQKPQQMVTGLKSG